MSSQIQGGLFFDALDTLFQLTPPHVIFSRAMSRLGHEISPEFAGRLLERANRWWVDPTRQPARTADEELVERRTYVEMVMQDYGRSQDDTLARHLVENTYWARWVRPFEDVRPALEGLYGKIQLALLSNGGPSIFDAVRFAGVASFFEQMSAGLELGVQKPAPSAYTRAAKRLGVLPEQSWMVDDTPENVAGAAAVGMHGVLLDRQGKHTDWQGHRVASLPELSDLISAGPYGI